MLTTNRNYETRSEVTLEEQIAWVQVMARSAAQHRSWFADILASLRELAEHRKRIGSAGRPEPEIITCGSCGLPQMVSRSNYEKLLAYADRMRAERDAALKGEAYSDRVALEHQDKRAAAEAERDAYKAGLAIVDKQRESAEAKLARVVEGPDDKVALIGINEFNSVYGTPLTRCIASFKAMSAELLRQAAAP